MASNMRPVVSYDDITLPYHQTPPQPQRPYSPKPPPAKKRKWNKKVKGRNHDSTQSLHISSNGTQDPPFASVVMEVEEEDVDEEGRDLTHDEIWDDSALIDAWNAATEEYEAYNGPDKGWKTEPVHKSPLWYNVPLTKGKAVTVPKSKESLVPDTSDMNEGDSHPLNFDTFVPSHNPSLDLSIPEPPSISGPDSAAQFLNEPPGPAVTQDEAFTRAMGAMYWTGYWTAMYHCQRRAAQDEEVEIPKGEEEEYEGEEEEGEEEGEEAFVSTQR